jgi:hypothetical protein
MLYEGYIIKGSKSIKGFEPDSIQNFNQQIADNYTKSVEVLENELLSLCDLLLLDGTLIEQN